MNIIGIIPARMASKRFPNKPMAKIHGIPMIGHVYLRSKMCKDLSDLYVATCDQEIADYILSIGGKVMITEEAHDRAADRAAEAMLQIEKEKRKLVDIVVMIQGDEPMITPEMIGNALSPLIIDKNLDVVNMMTEIKHFEDYEDPNEIKVVVDIFNNALYFSREPIPSRKKGATGFPMLKQVAITPFRRDFLIEYSQMIATPLELVESIGMMRVLENGIPVKMVFSDLDTYSVDVPADLKFVEEQMIDDVLMIEYI